MKSQVNSAMNMNLINTIATSQWTIPYNIVDTEFDCYFLLKWDYDFLCNAVTETIGGDCYLEKDGKLFLVKHYGDWNEEDLDEDNQVMLSFRVPKHPNLKPVVLIKPHK